MKKKYVLIVVCILLFACKEAYNPPVPTPVTGYLVVDGYINSAAGHSKIILTRTTKLQDSIIRVVYEYGAQVSIEGENGAAYSMHALDSGTYVSDVLLLDAWIKYRVHIQTADGKEYASDYAPVKITPAIDAIRWEPYNGGVQIYVNSHDAQNSTKYYQYRYTETWEFRSPFMQSVFYIRDQDGRIVGVTGSTGGGDTTIYKCWKTQNPSTIMLTSTEKLSADSVHFPIRYIEPQSEELSVLYYIEVHQYALSRDAYLFRQKLKKNTEQLGTIFDAQPSELSSNIHCVTNPAEQVIGFVDVTEEQMAKLFIHNSEVPGWPIHMSCTEVSVDNVPENYTESLTPTRIHETGLGIGMIKSYYAADPICVDCTLRGTNVRPSFWP